MRIDPDNITNYILTPRGLEEHLIFWILVAGKTARQIVRVHEALIDMLTGYCPARDLSTCIRTISEDRLAKFLRHQGCGCHTIKAKALKSWAEIRPNLSTCTPQYLTRIYGVGPKTARCFILHSREGARYAGLDTHILKWFRDVLGVDAPMATPSSEKQYRKLELIFLDECDRRGMTPAELDLEVWKSYRK